ncbi:cyanate permease [Cellulomonas sp. PhB143]|nr:cyanate permease [Cellulomonas sp. PhB143]
MFGLVGLTFSSWLSRLPSIRADLGISSGELGGLLVVGAVGATVSVVSAGALVVRFGNRTVLTAATAATVVGFVLIGVSTVVANPALFAVGVFVNGLAGPAANVPINLDAALVEKHVGRAIMPHFHAAFSVGAAVGALTAAAFAHAHVSVAVQVIVVAVVSAAARFAIVAPCTALAHEAEAEGRAEVVAGGRGSSVRTALAAWREPRTVMIGLVVLAAALSEGSAGDWLSIAVVDGFDEKEAVGAVAYASFIAAMTVLRIAGPQVIGRWGRVAVLRGSGVLSLVGLALFGFAPTLVLAWVGILAWGLGAALANPIGISAASDDPRHAAARVSVVTSFASFSKLGAPPLLGLVADATGARHALMLICAAMVVSLVFAGQVRPLGASVPPVPPIPPVPPAEMSNSAPRFEESGAEFDISAEGSAGVSADREPLRSRRG